MKNRISIVMIAMFLFGTASAFGVNKTEKFKVYGNCSMCEKRIETAAKSIDGVTSADWNKETKMIEVTFDDAKTDIHKVHMAIAKAGHDTEMHKATDEAYNSLPGCCKYERTLALKEK